MLNLEKVKSFGVYNPPKVVKEDEFNHYDYYIINSGREDCMRLKVTLPKEKKEASREIIEEGEFSCGYKVVHLKDGSYGYVRESDGWLMPYRYDVASSFGETGLAMVAKNGCVTWLNTKFQYLNEKSVLMEYDKSTDLEGFETIYNFSLGKEPLSMVVKRYGEKAVSYIDCHGKLKNFYGICDGKVDFKNGVSSFSNGYSFDEKGLSIVGGMNILFDIGVMLNLTDVIDMNREKEYLGDLYSELAKQIKDNEKNNDKKLLKNNKS